MPVSRTPNSKRQRAVGAAVPLGRRAAAQVDHHLAVLGELDRVGHQVGQHLAQAQRVAVHHRRQVRAPRGSSAPGPSRGRAAPAAPACPRPRARSVKSIGASSSLPASIFEKSRMSLMISSSDSPERYTACAKRRWRSSSAVPSSSSVMPRMPFIGVRISWLMLARNWLLAWLAACGLVARAFAVPARARARRSRPRPCRRRAALPSGIGPRAGARAQPAQPLGRVLDAQADVGALPAQLALAALPRAAAGPPRPRCRRSAAGPLRKLLARHAPGVEGAARRGTRKCAALRVADEQAVVHRVGELADPRLRLEQFARGTASSLADVAQPRSAARARRRRVPQRAVHARTPRACPAAPAARSRDSTGASADRGLGERRPAHSARRRGRRPARRSARPRPRASCRTRARRDG